MQKYKKICYYRIKFVFLQKQQVKNQNHESFSRFIVQSRVLHSVRSTARKIQGADRDVDNHFNGCIVLSVGSGFVFHLVRTKTQE